MNLEIRKIEITSPIQELKIGEYFLKTKIKRFYKEVPFWNGIERKMKKNEGGHPVWMELDNLKIILLGYLKYNDIFLLSDSFNLNK
jgi:hypothetical protein